MASMSDIENALRYTYLTPARLRYLHNKEVVCYNIVRKKKEKVEGRTSNGQGQVIVPIEYQSPTGFSGTAEGGTIPTARQPATNEATFGLQEYTGSVDVTWRALKQAMSSSAAFKSVVKILMDGIKRHGARMLNADILSDGRGILGTLPAANDGTVILSLDRPSMAEENMLVDLLDHTDDDTAIAADRSVTDLDLEAKTVTISGANVTGSAAGNYLTIANSVSSSGGAQHMLGLLAIISEDNPATVVGNVGGIDRDAAGTRYWRSAHLKSSSGNNRDLTEDLLLTARRIQRLNGGGSTDCILSNDSIAQRYHEILADSRFFAFASAMMKMKGGVGPEGYGDDPTSKSDGKTPYDFGGVPWHTDAFFPPNTVIGLDKDHLWFGHSGSDVLMPESELFRGRPMFRQTSSTTYEMVIHGQFGLLTDRPGAHWRVDNVAEA